MDVYNPHKYCNKCKNIFVKGERNPKFLSCKHLLCTFCFNVLLEEDKVRCPCGAESTLPIPDHNVFPEMDLPSFGAGQFPQWPSAMYSEPEARGPFGYPLTTGNEDSKWRWTTGVTENAEENAKMASGRESRASGRESRASSVPPPEQEVQNPQADLRFATGSDKRDETIASFPSLLHIPQGDMNMNLSIFDDTLSEQLPIYTPRFSAASFLPANQNLNNLDCTLSDQLPIYTPRFSTPTVLPVNQHQNAGTGSAWNQPNNNIFERRFSTDEPRHMTQTTPTDQNTGTASAWSLPKNENLFETHSFTQEPRPTPPVTPTDQMAGASVWSQLENNNIFGRRTVKEEPRATQAVSPMTQVLSDHSEAIEGFSLMINNLERETVARSAIDFIKEFKRTVERNRDGLQEYERESSELLSRSKVRSIAFDVALERPSKAFDDYLAIKFSLESMVKEGEDKEKGFGVSLLSKLTSLFVYLNFRNSLNGEATGLINISRKSSQDAATNTHYDGGEAYSVWLGTLEQRAEMARQITDPTAIIPLGWLVNTLPNVFFLEFSLEHKVLGTVLIETNPAIAPVMSANFALLCDKSRSCSYLNCVVFQCWKDESIITGDNETDKGTGGRSVLNGDFLVPDDTGLKPFRGAVGMRRLKKRISEEGKISSQFRITLQEVNKITAIFGRVVKGIEVVDRISRYGDRNGNPKRVITITDCGKI